MLSENKKPVSFDRLDGGLVTLYPKHQLKTNQSPDCKNFDPTVYGQFKKRLGYAKFTSAAKGSPTGNGSVNGLFAGATSAGTAVVLAAEGTTLNVVTAGTWGAVISGLTITVNTRVHLMMYNDKVLIGNAGGGPYVTSDFATGASLGGSPPANAIGGMVHRSRVWWFPANSSVATFSGLNAETDYTSADNAGSITINKGDGMAINGMWSGGNFAIISKIAPSSGGTEGKLYLVNGSSPFDFAVQKIADFGATGPDAGQPFDLLVVIATNRGIYAIQGFGPTKISQNIKPTYDAITGTSSIAVGRYKTTIRASYSSSAGQNDNQLIVDLERGVWGLNSTKPFSRYANHPDGRLLAGSTTSGGPLIYIDDSGTDDNGGAIDCYWVTKAEDAGMVAAPKWAQAVDLFAENTGNFSWTVTHLIDAVDTGYSDTMNVSTQGPVKRMIHLNSGKRGKLHQIKIRNNAATQPMTANTIMLWLELGQPGSV